jgi:hypothetical protein
VRQMGDHHEMALAGDSLGTVAKRLKAGMLSLKQPSSACSATRLGSRVTQCLQAAEYTDRQELCL